jgi:hypothetical protein
MKYKNQGQPAGEPVMEEVKITISLECCFDADEKEFFFEEGPDFEWYSLLIVHTQEYALFLWNEYGLAPYDIDFQKLYDFLLEEIDPYDPILNENVGKKFYIIQKTNMRNSRIDDILN